MMNATLSSYKRKYERWFRRITMKDEIYFKKNKAMCLKRKKNQIKYTCVTKSNKNH